MSHQTHSARYRVYQFFAALKAYLPARLGGLSRRLSVADQQLVAQVLPTTAQQQLFGRMSPNDQRHALAVARTLQTAGHQHPALLQAALLHDVAKALGQPIPHRVAIVLLEAFQPALLARLSHRAEAATNSKAGILAISWWRRPFVIHAHHPAIGAEWATTAACHPLAVELILRHQDSPIDPPETEADQLLIALQWADNLN